MSGQRVTSRKNAFLLHVRKLLSSASYRKETGEFVGDGIKLMDSGFQAKFPMCHLIYSDNQHPSPMARDIPITFVPEDVMAWLSPMKSPQGGLFVAKQPSYALETLSGNYLLLDGVQDPGNVGTIWRTAHGLGASGLILLEQCASPWSHKTVRSSMGACFHLPVYEMTGEQAVALFSKQGYPLYGTALEPESKAISQVSFQNCGVIIGSEGQGVRQSLLQACDQTIYLPMAEGCQSFNAAIAAGIFLWEMGKDRLSSP